MYIVFQGTNEILRLFISLTCLQYAGNELREMVKSVSYLDIATCKLSLCDSEFINWSVLCQSCHMSQSSCYFIRCLYDVWFFWSSVNICAVHSMVTGHPRFPIHTVLFALLVLSCPYWTLWNVYLLMILHWTLKVSVLVVQLMHEWVEFHVWWSMLPTFWNDKSPFTFPFFLPLPSRLPLSPSPSPAFLSPALPPFCSLSLEVAS